MSKRKFHIWVGIEMIKTEQGYEPISADWRFGKYDTEPGNEELLAAIKTAALNEIKTIKSSDLWPNIELSTSPESAK